MHLSHSLFSYFASLYAREQVAHKITLAKAEGELLSIAALRRLDLNTGTDEDGFQFYQWELAAVARELAELYVRKLIPESWKAFFNDLCYLAESIDKEAWTYFYKSAVKDEECFLAMEDSDVETLSAYGRRKAAMLFPER